MAEVLVRMTDEQKAKLQAQAERESRSMTSYIINLIERDSEVARLQLVTEEQLKKYFTTPEGIEQTR